MSAQLMQEAAAAKRRHRGRGSKQTWEWDLAPSSPAQLPREPRARPKRGGGSPQKPLGWTVNQAGP